VTTDRSAAARKAWETRRARAGEPACAAAAPTEGADADGLEDRGFGAGDGVDRSGWKKLTDEDRARIDALLVETYTDHPTWAPESWKRTHPDFGKAGAASANAGEARARGYGIVTERAPLLPKDATRCPRCRGKVVRRRCRACDKDTPSPGTPSWSRWTMNISREIRDRCWKAGLQAHAMPAMEAIVFDRGTCPPEVAELLADIAALPCSRARYEVVLERALNEVGLSLRLPDLHRQRLRVEAPRARIAASDENDHAAELEAAAEEQTANAVGG